MDYGRIGYVTELSPARTSNEMSAHDDACETWL